MLAPCYRDAIYSIYGFVRFADEIVDTFHDHDKSMLLQRFRADTYDAVDRNFSLNPVLHAFARTVNQYQIPRRLYDIFFDSMEMDLTDKVHDRESFEAYVLGSAEVVGLMCLRVFVDGDDRAYQDLTPYAMRLGAAFQKINFLRDLRNDFENLGRQYFPGIDLSRFDESAKHQMEREIDEDFEAGLQGIRKLPRGSRFGVYMAYVYYTALFKKIRRLSPRKIMETRIRVPDSVKYLLLCSSYIRHRLNLI